MAELPRFTIVVPMKNEAQNVRVLAKEIAEACQEITPFEAIFVNDGSEDGTAEAIEVMRKEYPWLRQVKHRQSCGQSAAVRSGVIYAKASIICTMDGDGQNPPLEIPRLVAPLIESQASKTLGLVAGQRVDRKDTANKRLASRCANGLRAWMLQDSTRDTGCGLKAFRREVFLALPFFDHLHRYLPALVKREGYAVKHIDVSHRPRLAGDSKYTNIGRAIVGARDLLGVQWLLHRRRLPHITEADE